MGATPLRVLMCPPAYFKIPAVENPHMHVGDQPDSHRAWLQWMMLRNAYQRLGLEVFEMPPYPQLWDMIFTANGGWVHKDKETGESEFVLSNFSQPIRQYEKPHFRRWAKLLKCKIFELPENIFFEGQGDVITLNNVYLFGHGFRSMLEARDYIVRLLRLQKPAVPLKLVDPRFYHLDTCCMSLRGTQQEGIVYFPGAFDEEGRTFLSSLSAKQYLVPECLAKSFVCNSVFINDVMFLNVPFSDYSDESFELSASGEFLTDNDMRFAEMVRHEEAYEPFVEFLWSLGYKIIPVYISEYLKSGAGSRCCTLFLD